MRRRDAIGAEKGGGARCITASPRIGELLEAVHDALRLDGTTFADRRADGDGELGIAVVVDDDHHVAAVVSDVLSALGLTVRVAHDHSEAYEVLRGFEPISLLLADYQMPDGPPWGLIERTRRDHPEAKIMGTSGESRRADFLAHGVRGFLAKPWQLADFRRCLQSVAIRS